MNLSTMSYRRKYMIPLRFEYIQSKNKKNRKSKSISDCENDFVMGVGNCDGCFIVIVL